MEKSTYIRSECPYSVFEHPHSVSKQKPRDYPPWIKLDILDELSVVGSPYLLLRSE